MPPLFVPHRSGVHRAACFALFRALLRQKNRLPLDQRQRPSLNWTLKTAFKHNATLDSNRKVIAALRLGYETLEIFQRFDEHPDKLRRVFDIVAASKQRMPSISTNASGNAPEKSSRGRRPKLPYPPPRVWPHPNNKPVLSRPFANLTGRRHVPKLSIGNKVPFLLFKKPQSPFLSRMIRDIIDERQRRILRRDTIDYMKFFAIEEDKWDDILESNFGVLRNKDGGSWAKESSKAADESLRISWMHDNRAAATASQMQKIVEKEQALADLEKRNRRQLKKRMRIARKEAGSGENTRHEDQAATIGRKMQEQALADLEKRKQRKLEMWTRITRKEGKGDRRAWEIEDKARPLPHNEIAQQNRW